MDFVGFLSARGYALAYRREGFVEVLASRGDERFVGRGLNDAEAIAHLSTLMFPSSAARALLSAALEGGAEVQQDAEAAGAQPVDAADVTPPTGADDDAPPADDAPAATEGCAASASASSEPQPAVDSAAAALRSAADVAEEVDEALAILSEIEERVDELSTLAAEDQRLLMLLWMCDARACVERVPEHEVHAAVARVSRRLSELSKILWPGSVRALQIGVQPAACLPRHSSSVRTWADAADAVEALMDERRHAQLRAGRDDDGYADAARLLPPPADPAAVFDEAKHAAASFDKTLDPRAAEAAAARLRWVRGRVPALPWGALVGKLRQKASALHDDGATLRKLLDSNFDPQAPWRDVVARGDAETSAWSAPAPPSTSSSPTVSRAMELRSSLIEAGSPPRWSEPQWLAWLADALVAFDTASLVDLLRPLRVHVAPFEATAFADRRSRRRFREVLGALADARDVGALSSTSLAAGDDIVDADDDDDDEAIDVGEAAFNALVARVREQTHGKAAVFVSNREDPALALKLSELLGLSLTWIESTPRRLEAACEKIARGSHQLVLSATGFQLHSADASLSRASRSAGVPFVRVNRGRPVACVLAIARELGIDRQPTKPVADSPGAAS